MTFAYDAVDPARRREPCELCGERLGAEGLSLRFGPKADGQIADIKAHIGCVYALGGELVEIGKKYGSGRGQQK